MIRNSENFVYIENQYFMGSAYTWHFDNETNCHHTIPAELVQKIVSKIASNQRFTAYVVIPMFPEGDPAHQAMQEILYWQTRTIEMMYGKIGEALRQSPSLGSSHPTDWLLFMCPGKRELPGPHLDQLEMPSDPLAQVKCEIPHQFNYVFNSDIAALAFTSPQTVRETLRFPIYVHSKVCMYVISLPCHNTAVSLHRNVEPLSKARVHLSNILHSSNSNRYVSVSDGRNVSSSS